MAIERTIARRMFNKLRRAGQICRPVLIVGTDADAVALLHAAQRTPHLGYRVVGFVGADDIGTRGGCEVLGPIERTADVLEATGATGVLISLSSVESEVVNRLTRELTDDGYHVALSSGLHDIDIVRFRAQDLGGRTLIYVEQIQRGGWRAVAKRDVRHRRCRSFALVLTAPITARRGDRHQALVAGPGHLRPGAGRAATARRSGCSSSARWSRTPRPGGPSSTPTTRPTARCSRWPTTRG